MKKILHIALYLGGVLGLFASDFNVKDYGAVGDGKNYDTKHIQKAIDECHAKGGGRVLLPSGTYLTGALWLRDNVEFHITKGATLLGSTRNKLEDGDYPEDAKAILHLLRIKNAAVSGLGTINGQGTDPVFNAGDGAEWRGKARRFNQIRVVNSENIRISDITLIYPQTWCVRLLKSDGVQIRGLNIYSFSTHNADGIDIDARNVVISDCIIYAEDDLICFKNYRNSPDGKGHSPKRNFDEPDVDPKTWDWMTENVTVTNCVLATNCNAIKLGTDSFNAFRNITVSNCVIRRAPTTIVKDRRGIFGIKHANTAAMGITLQMVDGGFMENISINNITMNSVMTPIFIRLGSRAGTPQFLKNVVISNVVAESESYMCSSITGHPGYNIEGITLRDIVIRSMGKGTKEFAQKPVPERPGAYPQNGMYGHTMPAHGFYVRHAENITFENVQLFADSPDERPAIVMDDVSNISINNFQGSSPSGGLPFIRLIDAKKVYLSNFRQYKNLAPKMFLKVEGKSSGIRLLNNDLDGVEKIFDAPDGSVEIK